MTNDSSLSAPATNLTNPSLAFGLTGLSDWSTEMPFLDLMKTSRPWIGHSAGNWGAVSTAELASGGYLDAQGWPTHIPTGLTSVGTVWDWGSSVADPAAAASRAGVYVLTYKGEGTLQIQGVNILSSAPGRIVVENKAGGTMIMSITATDPDHTGDYIRDISLVPQKYEALHAAGEIFNPDWLSVVQDARELRFMDWMQTNGVTHASWDDRAQVDDVSWASRGAPVEVMVQLANQTGTEPWFNIPAGADEAYIRNFATYVRDHLNPDLKAHVEYSNETWNWSFGQTQWLSAQAQAVWGAAQGGSAWLDYAAMLATKSALIWDDVFGASAATRVDNVLATQTVNPWITEHLLNAPLWQSQEPSTYVAPSSVFDSVAVTTYFGGSTMASATLRAELLNVINTPGANATAWLAAKLMDPTYSQSIPQVMASLEANKAVADKYGLDLVAYEGGQHVLQSFAISGMSSADQATLTTFLSGFARSPEMATLYQALWTGWAQVSDGPFMQFGDVAAASKWGAWGIFSALGDHNPRADLLTALNAQSATWFGDGGGTRYQQGVIKLAGDSGGALAGTEKADFLIGGNGNDTIFAHGGNDMIFAGKGHDTIGGGMGQDTLVLSGSPGAYRLTAEGTGYSLVGPGASHFIRSVEIFKFDTGVALRLGEMLHVTTAIEAPLGTVGRDFLLGSAQDDAISTGAGNDSVHGGLGDDMLNGGTGADLLYGDAGNDQLLGGMGQDTLHAGFGDDTLQGGYGSDQLAGSVGADLLYGGADNDSLAGGMGLDSLVGGSGDDILYGGNGADTLLGGYGSDTLVGGYGSDWLTGGPGQDTFVFYPGDNTPAAPDLITDFNHAQHDVIVFSDLAHSFRGTAEFGGTAGEVRYVSDPVKGVVHVYLDADGDRHADAALVLAGVHVLVAADFGL